MTDIERRVAAYYAERLREHGTTPAGVDWNSESSQQLRFAQLLRVVDDLAAPFSINDWGCGYGALAEELERRGADFRYHGYDIAETMVAAARERLGNRSDRTVSSDPAAIPEADYTVASGIFNVLAGNDREAWEGYVRETVRQMVAVSRRGVAFNVLTRYSDPEYMQDRLYYADPGALLDFCVRECSRRVAVLHDYGLYEFTTIVRLEGGSDGGRR
jgi:SAM-dependent methyltransferase